MSTHTEPFTRHFCPRCGAGLRVTQAMASKRLRCPVCGERLRFEAQRSATSTGPQAVQPTAFDDDWEGLEELIPGRSGEPVPSKGA